MAVVPVAKTKSGGAAALWRDVMLQSNNILSHTTK